MAFIEWYDGACSRCSTRTQVAAVDHDEFAEVCLVCLDALAEQRDTSLDEVVADG